MFLESRSLRTNCELCNLDGEAGESSVQILPESCLAQQGHTVYDFIGSGNNLENEIYPQHAVNSQDPKARYSRYMSGLLASVSRSSEVGESGGLNGGRFEAVLHEA